MSDHYDAPWKELIESSFSDFLAFFFPKVHGEIDWGRGYASLEQELHPIAPQSELGLHVVDKLLKVWRKGDGERFVLIHVEIQSEYDAELPRRMFTYHYRAFDLHQRPVMSLAVVGDSSASWRPPPYFSELWECEVRLAYPVVKLQDYNDRWEELEASQNPFAVMVMAHLKTRATRHDPEERYRWKLRLIRRLYEQEWGESEVVKLYGCLDRLLALPEELGLRFWEELSKYEKEKRMAYVTSVERIGYQRGIQDGILQGMEQGIERGIQQGVRQGEVAALERLLVRRFDALPPWAEELLAGASLEQLGRWLDRVVDAEQLEDVFATP